MRAQGRTGPQVNLPLFFLLEKNGTMFLSSPPALLITSTGSFSSSSSSSTGRRLEYWRSDLSRWRLLLASLYWFLLADESNLAVFGFLLAASLSLSFQTVTSNTVGMLPSLSSHGCTARPFVSERHQQTFLSMIRLNISSYSTFVLYVQKNCKR